MTGLPLRIIAIYLVAGALYTWAGWRAVRRGGVRTRLVVWLATALLATSLSVAQLPVLRTAAAGHAVPPAALGYALLAFTLWLTAFGGVSLVLDRHRAARRLSLTMAAQALGAYVVAILVWGTIVIVALGDRLRL